jgi:hypothetical protein
MEILHYDYWAEHISKDEKNQRLKQLKEQAKEMHKKEIEDACKSSITSCGMGHIFIELPEQYYEQTYGGGEQ